MNNDQGGTQRGTAQPPTGNNDPSRADQAPHIPQDLSRVRSGDLAPYEERAPIQPLADATAISPHRAIPPEQVTAIIDRYRHVDPEEAMIPVLQEMQTKFGYITQDAAEQMAIELGLPAADVYGVITFYSFFRYTPRAGHVIMSCEGTSCYVRGAGQVRGAFEELLDVGPGDTTADGTFTFEPQSICLGACDLGPLVEIEGAYYTHVTPEKVSDIIAQWRDAGEHTPLGDNMTGGHHYEENHGFGPTSDELYAGYEVARFMPAGVGPEASNTQAPGAVSDAIHNMPPTPNPGGASGSQSQA